MAKQKYQMRIPSPMGLGTKVIEGTKEQLEKIKDKLKKKE